jgi:hypothetical protein
MTAAKKSRATVRKRNRRQREREQPRTAPLRKVTDVIQKNIEKGGQKLDLSEFLIPPKVD